MSIRAVVFDIGGVLEINEPGSLERIWEPRLGLGPGELGDRLAGVAASATTCWYRKRELGVPLCTSTGRPLGSPYSSTARVRPSAVVIRRAMAANLVAHGPLPHPDTGRMPL